MTEYSAEHQEYYDRSLGRPLSIESTIMLAQELADIPSLTTNWQAGLVYVPSNVVAKAKNYGKVEVGQPRLTPDEVIDSCLEDIAEAGILEAGASEPVKLPGKRLATRPAGKFCRLVVKVFDIPCGDYQPIPGQVLGEKIRVAQKLAPKHTAKPRRSLNEISHDITIGAANIEDLEKLDKAAGAVNSKFHHRLLPDLELLELGIVQSTVRVKTPSAQ